MNELLESQYLSVQDIVANVRGARGTKLQGSRVVLDGRAESAYLNHPNQPKKEGIESDIVGSEAVNADMELDPLLRAVGGWRGPMAVGRQSEEYEIAMHVIAQAMALSGDARLGPDVLDKDWLPDGALDHLLGKGESLQAEKICKLAKACSRQLSSYPSLVRVTAPAKVFGDIHGQFRDMLLLFSTFGRPFHCGGDIQTTSYVFNGDFVDRGAHQLEVITLLFALHVVYPVQVFLVRGNHEFRDMSENMGELGFLCLAQRSRDVPLFCLEGVVLKPQRGSLCPFPRPLEVLLGSLSASLSRGFTAKSA
ncbi:unnamed protein product [Effrenium voratum]|uniref:Serine/threonine-protein phosphatase n=1 Tax=Effrenium voratum TaxID=2562239 RepID=A0AA36MS83_9DINO|nr:unnamed protein product [Effrenium voratum]